MSKNVVDLGKVLLLPSFGGLPQWAVVGKNFVSGTSFIGTFMTDKIKGHFDTFYRWHVPPWLCFWWIDCASWGDFLLFEFCFFPYYRVEGPSETTSDCLILQQLKGNPDNNNPTYNTKYGVYSEGCGLNNVVMSWGHDDYMYLVCIFFIIQNKNLSNLVKINEDYSWFNIMFV